MSYGKYDSEKYSEIQNIIQKMLDLEPGSQLPIKGDEDSNLSRTRYLLFEFIHHYSGLGPREFKVKTRPNLLIVERKPLPSAPKTQVNPEMSEKLEKVFSSLIENSDINNPDSIESYIEDLIRKEEINLREAQILLSQYESVFGKERKKK